MYAFFNIQKEHLNTHNMCKSIICYTAKIIRISRMIEMFVNLDNEFLKLKSNTKRKLILIHFFFKENIKHFVIYIADSINDVILKTASKYDCFLITVKDSWYKANCYYDFYMS